MSDNDTDPAGAPRGPVTDAPGGAAPEAAPRTPGWVRVVLVLSLAANLAVAGLVAGAAVMRHRDGDRMEPREIAAAPFLAALPPEERRELFRSLRPDAGSLRENRRALEAEGRQALAALRAEPFEAEAFAASLAAQGGKVAERVAVGDRALVERVAAMTPQARAEFAERLEEVFARTGRRGRRGD